MSVELVGMAKLKARFSRLPKRIADETSRFLYDHEVRPLARSMASAAAGLPGAASKSAATLSVVRLRDGAQVRAGGGGGLGSELLYGTEFGGRRRPRRAYVTRSRRGTPYIVRRRTTMQFLPHLGRRGYWYWPSVRRDLKGVRKRIHDVMVKVANDG